LGPFCLVCKSPLFFLVPSQDFCDPPFFGAPPPPWCCVFALYPHVHLLDTVPLSFSARVPPRSRVFASPPWWYRPVFFFFFAHPFFVYNSVGFVLAFSRDRTNNPFLQLYLILGPLSVFHSASSCSGHGSWTCPPLPPAQCPIVGRHFPGLRPPFVTIFPYRTGPDISSCFQVPHVRRSLCHRIDHEVSASFQGVVGPPCTLWHCGPSTGSL